MFFFLLGWALFYLFTLQVILKIYTTFMVMIRGGINTAHFHVFIQKFMGKNFFGQTYLRNLWVNIQHHWYFWGTEISVMLNVSYFISLLKWKCLCRKSEIKCLMERSYKENNQRWDSITWYDIQRSYSYFPITASYSVSFLLYNSILPIIY